jgi:peptide/nickel transport system permease protein
MKKQEEETATVQQPEFNFRKYSWKQFKRNKPALISFYVLLVFAVIALLAPYLANERPLYAKYKGQTFYPAFTSETNYRFKDAQSGDSINLQLDITDWKRMEFESVVWPIVPWSPTTKDKANRRWVGPGDPQRFITSAGDTLHMPSRFRHRLGTNESGEDVLAGLIHGARISLSIGFISMGIASIIGLFLGAVAGFFGDNRLQMPRARYYMIILSIPFAWFYGFHVRAYNLSDAMAESGTSFLISLLISIAVFALVITAFSFIGKLMSKGNFLGKRITVPLDTIISRGIEILNSIPVMILIISLAAMVKEYSIIYVMVIIGLTSWTGIARFTRAEFLKIRSMDYISAAQVMGFPERRIIFRHALINGMAPSLVSIAFGIAAAILIESGLSFIGVGLPTDVVTWGKLLNQGRENFHAWWLILFPGLAIFMVVTVYNLIGEGLRDALDPKLKR